MKATHPFTAAMQTRAAGPGTLQILREHTETVGAVSLEGQTNLTGTVHLDLGQFGVIVGQIVARGLAVAKGQMSHGPARDDNFGLTGGLHT
jgi:hypothetical protein